MSSTEKPAEAAVDQKTNGKGEQSSSKEVKKKTGIFSDFFHSRRSGFRALVYGGIAAFFITWGGFYYNNRHAPPWIAVFLVFIGGIFGALATRQILVNNFNS